MLKRFLPFVLMLLWIASAAGAAGLDFVPNVGQIRNESAFSTEIPGAHVAFRNTSFEYTFAVSGRLAPARMEMIGANPRTAIAGTGLLPGIVNVHTSTARFSEIPTYGGLRYKSVYPGIDLEIDGAAGNLKSTWVVAPHVDPARIRWRYEGFDHVVVDRDGNLNLTLPAEPGEEPRVVTETAPVAWQNVDGQRIPVKVRYQERKDGSLSFEVGSYDEAAPLVIDPTLIYNEKLYSLTSGGDAVAADAVGNAYLAGQTTLGFSYLTKLDSGAVRRWTTYFDDDTDARHVHDVEMGPNGHVYVAGSGSRQGFVAKLDSGTGIGIWQSGNGQAGYYAIAVDAQDNSYVAGMGTLRKRNPAGGEVYTALLGVTNLTEVALDGVNPVVAGSEQGLDVYVAALDAGGRIVQETTFGGSEYDFPTAIAVDAFGRTLVVGRTASADFPLVDPVDAELTDAGVCGAPCSDGFVVQLGGDLDVRTFSTFFGGNRADAVEDVAVGSDGAIYFAGWTETGVFGGFPLVDAIAPLMGGGDAFIAKLRFDPVVGIPDIQYCTPLGDPAFDAATSFAVNATGIYVTGSTRPSAEGQSTAFLAKLRDEQHPLGDVVNVNFQPRDSQVPDGYIPDSGEPFQLRDNGWSYGWVQFGNRDLPPLAASDADLVSDQRYDTYVSQASIEKTLASWEIGLKPGRYRVRLVAGTPNPPSGPHWTQAYAEGVPILSAPRSENPGNRWVEGAVDVEVDDGRLTLTLDSQTSGWDLAFVEISKSRVANLPPRLKVTAPLQNEVFNAGRPVTIHVDTDDRDGRVERVLFYVSPAGGRRTILANLAAPGPFQLNWGGCHFDIHCPGLPAGTYTVEAVARDNEGAEARSFVTFEVRPLETKRDEFKVELRVFLPDTTLEAPILPILGFPHRSIKGDARGFSTTSREYRVAQQVTVIPSKALDEDGIDETTIVKLGGLSVLYDTGSSVNPEIGGLTPQASSEALVEANKDVPYMVDFGRIDAEENSSISALPRTDPLMSRTRFEGEVPDPTNWMPCTIDWEIDVAIDTTIPGSPQARVSGTHNGMPAYEILVDGQPVYLWRPPFEDGIVEYCTSTVKIDPAWIPLR